MISNIVLIIIIKWTSSFLIFNPKIDTVFTDILVTVIESFIHSNLDHYPSNDSLFCLIANITSTLFIN